ncbi:hypothetical protein Tco_1103345 [Tanacetum coccineum]
MTIFLDISRRARDAYHNLQDDDIMKNIFNSGRNKNKVGMRIPAWMITDEMKLTEHYKMYAEVFGLDVPLTQQSARLTPPVPVPSAEKADEMILQDMIQVSLAEHKSHEEQEARENVALVYEHLVAEEIEKLVEEPENVDDSSPPKHDDTSILGTRLEPRSDKESPKVEIIQEKEEETTKEMEVEPDKDILMVDVTNIVIPVNVDDEEDEITDEVFELRRRLKRKNVEETRISPIPSPTRSPRNLSTLVSLDTEKLQELTVTQPTPSSGSSAPKLTKTNRLLSLIKAKPNRFKRYKGFFHELQGRYGYLFAHLKKRFMPRTSSDQLADNLHDVMMETLPSLVKEKERKRLREDERLISKAIIMKFEKDLGENMQKAEDIRYEANVSKSPSFGPVKCKGTRSFYLSNCRSVDDDIEEQTSNGNKCIRSFNLIQDMCVENWKKPHAEDLLHKRDKRTLEDLKEGEYSTLRIVQCSLGVQRYGKECMIFNFESKAINRRLISLHQQLHSQELKNMMCFLLFMNNYVVLLLHFAEWIKKFNPYARYGVENWKNHHAKIFYIRRQKEPGRPKEEIYSNSMIVQVIKTYWELSCPFKVIVDVYLPLVEFSYINSYHSSMICAPFEALYDRKCHSPIMWAEVGEGQLIGPELV